MKTWLLAAIFAIMKGLSNTHFLYRPYLQQAIFLVVFTCAFTAHAQNNPLIPAKHPINLLQPLDDTTTQITPQNGDPFETFRIFFDISWPLIIGTAAGVAVLWALVAGIEIMLSGSNSGMRDSGKNHLYSAIAGLLLIGLAGMILQILNPIFFTQ